MPSWPDGVTTTTLLFGKGITIGGNMTSSRLAVEPIFQGTDSVVWATDGTPMLPFSESASADDGSYGSIAIPVVDQSGWLDSGQHPYTLWGYKLTETPSYGRTPGKQRVKYWQPLTGQTTVDFDRIPDGSIGLPSSGPIAVVTSVNGQVGAVTVTGGDGAPDSAVAALVNNASSATRTALTATYQPLIPQLEAVPLLREGDSYDDGSQGADQASRPFARLALRHNMGAVTKTSVAGTRMDQILARVISNGYANRRGLICIADGVLNDVFQFGAVGTGGATTQEAWRTLLAYLSAQGVSTITSAAVRFGPGWTAGSTSTTGAYVDVAFSTATAYLLVNYVTGTGGTATIKNTTGSTVATVTTGGYQQPFVGAVKLTGTAGTTTTYRLAVTTGSIQIAGVAAKSATPAPIVWDKAGAIQSGATTNNPRILDYQAACTTVLADFPNVLPVGMGSGWNASTMISTEDGIHRNDLGNQYALAQIEAVLRAYLTTSGLYQGLSRLTASGSTATYTDPTAVYVGPGAAAPATMSAPAVTAADTNASLTWAIPADNGSSITGYTVQYKLHSGSTWTPFGTTFAGTTSGGTVTGLTASTQYDFQVAAVNSVGTSAWSPTATATTTTPLTTYVADNFSAKANGAMGTTSTGGLSWTFPTGASFSMSGGLVQLTAATTAPYDAYVDDGQANGTISCTSGVNQGGLVLRASGTGDINGYVLWRNGGNYVLSRRDGANSYTQIGISSGITANFGDALKIIMNGSAFTVFINGAQAFTATDATYTGTRHGLWSLSSTASNAWQGTFSHTSALA